ncbi:hypothetical protein [Peribacillus frigoritolerans]|uniref:Uncharacterized protein n=1 Tax=Peribacillus castrilensis TaxID=2897690 RepID=A0AAW9NJB4_9BACI|nr:hypothetical protein [Peribacillus castrilensis]
MIGDMFYVNPENSLKFGDRWGELSVLKSDSLLPYGLRFEGDSIPYYFSRDEILSEDEFEAVYEVVACPFK